MRVVIAHRSGGPRVVELPEPRLSRHFVAVRISHCGLTLPRELFDLSEAPKKIPKGQDGLPLGYGASGIIESIGADVKGLKEGLRVAVAGKPYVYHSDHLVVPEPLVIELPKKVSHEEACFTGQGAAGLHLVRTAGISLGEVVLVFGGGLAGLIVAQLVRAAGAETILVEDSEFRRKKAKALGINHVVDPENDQLADVVDALTEGHGADAALLTLEQDETAFRSAQALVRLGGVLALGAPVKGAQSLSLLQESSIALKVAIGAGPGWGDRDFEVRGSGYPRRYLRWNARENMICFSRLLAERRVQIAPLVSHRMPLERAPSVYERALEGRDSVLGVVLTT